MPFVAVYPEDARAWHENEQAIKEILKHFTYRPRWHFETSLGMLRVTAEVVDANNPDRMIPLIFDQPIPRHPMRDFDWTRWLFEQIKNIEHHELQEFFRIDGKPVYEPHPELVGR
jgi:hypothetical protein